MKCRSSLVKKLSGSLHSSNYQPGITAQGRPGDKMSIGRLPLPTNPKTVNQELHRLLYSKCSIMWGFKDSEEKDLYSAEAKVKYLTNYNVFMGQCLIQQLYQLFETKTPKANNTRDCFALNWFGLRMKCGEGGTTSDHLLHRVKLKLYRVGLPGKFVVSIRACTQFGKPTGSDLTIGEIDGNELTMDSKGEWYNIDLGGTPVKIGDRKAICFRAPDGNAFRYVGVRCYIKDPPIFPALSWNSTDGGSTWNDTGTISFPYYGYGVLEV